MRARLFLLPVVGLSLLLFAACGDDDDNDDTTPSGGGTTTASPATGGGSATVPAPTTASSGTAAPRADGTVAPQNAGDTRPVPIKANPENFAGQATLTKVRIGIHPEEGGWERFVFEFAGTFLPPATVEYVTAASECGSGAAVTLPGTAILQVRFGQAVAHNDAGQVTVNTLNLSGPGNTILRARQTCDFEAVVIWALGLKAKQNFKVTTLQNPVRLVIDIKQ
ncbi:MAG: AMIN-like domain-containing (lipo)protein [Tepidiformaceae bacterium]